MLLQLIVESMLLLLIFDDCYSTQKVSFVNCGRKVLSVLVPYVSNKKHVGEYTQLTVVPSAREKLGLFFFF